MLSPFTIPLSGSNETFAITLAGIQYQLTVMWRDAAGFWALNIADQNANPIVAGVPLVTGADLLAQYGYLDFGFQLWVSTPGDPTQAVPTFANLGTANQLVALVPAAAS